MRYKDFAQKLSLVEGGNFGHLNNIYDDGSLKFKDLKDVIYDSLKGNLEFVREKTDGQNLMFTWKDGQIKFARSSKHSVHWGENAMTRTELAQKFKGRGTIEMAFNHAGRDLSMAISKLSEKQRNKIFKEGKKFMSVEVLHLEQENLISYGIRELRFHGTREYDYEGNVIADTMENKKDGDILAGMIKQINQDNQKTYQIKTLNKVSLPEIPKFEKQAKELINKLDRIMKKFKLSNSDTINDYKKKYFESLGISDERIIDRFANGNKSYKITQIKKDFSGPELNKIIKIDKDIQKHIKNIMLPLEYIFLNLGSRVLKNMTEFMAISPEKTVQKLKDRLSEVIDKVSKSEDPKLLDKMKLELKRIEQAGGTNAIFPTEGITFIWKDGFYKLVGNFAPLNQLSGILWKL